MVAFIYIDKFSQDNKSSLRKKIKALYYGLCNYTPTLTMIYFTDQIRAYNKGVTIRKYITQNIKQL